MRGSTAGSGEIAGKIVNGGVGGVDAVGLTKSGTGTWTLSGANTYTGPTTVGGGTLIVNGSIANSAVSLSSGATLKGSGSIVGAVTLVSGSTISPGNSIESLATGALTLPTGSTYAYELNGDAAPSLAGDLLAVTGNLTINGATLTLTELGSGAWSNGEKLTLIGYTGTWSGGLFNLGGAGRRFDVHAWRKPMVHQLQRYDARHEFRR
ncbi:MAG: autotransporter-associated beta strand repeat-containing protein [Pirellulales bacterium]